MKTYRFEAWLYRIAYGPRMWWRLNGVLVLLAFGCAVSVAAWLLVVIAAGMTLARAMGRQ